MCSERHTDSAAYRKTQKMWNAIGQERGDN